MRILAYADKISAGPGDRLELKVSCDGIARYDAALVRVIQGDRNPDGPGYAEEEVALDLGGPFRGRFQPLRTGSCAIVDGIEAGQLAGGFTIVVAVWPTLPGDGAQTILAIRDASTGRGVELGLDVAGAAALTVSDGRHVVELSTGVPLLRQRWYVLAASVDPVAGRAALCQRPELAFAAAGETGAASAAVPGADLLPADMPLTIAARPDRGGWFERFFNGRIEAPRIYAQAMAPEAACGLPAGGGPQALHEWDFSQRIDTDAIRDTGRAGRDGRLLNLPARGVTGRRWREHMRDWRAEPEGYGAIHFHDDDLADAGWETDFAVTLPPDLHSGVYAFRLSAGEERFYVPFGLRAAPDRRERAAFLLPTASYMAYANNRIGIDVPETETVCGRLIELHEGDLFMQQHPELGLCFYDAHNDGSPVYYSTRSRPVVDMQPGWVGKLGGIGSNVWQFNADTHVLGWLEATGTPFDVVTDEDLHLRGRAALDGYAVVLTGSHPEYYSLSMLEGLRGWIGAGGRLIYLGGNGFYWRISFHPGRPDIIECRKSEDGIRIASPLPGEYHASLTGEYTGLWRRNGIAPQAVVGVGMVAQGFDASSPYRRTAESRSGRAAFAFEGVEAEIFGDYGLSGLAAAGIEVDAVDHALGTPPSTIVLAASEIHTDLYLMTPEDMLDAVPGMCGTEAEIIRSTITFFDNDAGGAVFSTGSIAWAGSMAWNGYANDVARITGNVLRRFLDPRPFD